MKKKSQVKKVLNSALSASIPNHLVNGFFYPNKIGGFLEWYFCDEQKMKFDEVKARIEKQLSGGFFKKTPYKAKVWTDYALCACVCVVFVTAPILRLTLGPILKVEEQRARNAKAVKARLEKIAKSNTATAKLINEFEEKRKIRFSKCVDNHTRRTAEAASLREQKVFHIHSYYKERWPPQMGDPRVFFSLLALTLSLLPLLA